MRTTACFLLLTVLAFIGAAPSQAVDWKTKEGFGAQVYYSTKTSVVSTHSVSGYITTWSVAVIGGTADFEIKHTTSVPGSFIQTSSTVYLSAGSSISDTPVGIMLNPVIYLKRIDAATTVYLDIGYLTSRGL